MSSTSQATNRYFAVADEYASPENSKVSIVPVPYPAGQAQSASDGPQAILAASKQVELFDEELWTEPCKVGIQTCDAVLIKPVDANAAEPFFELREAIGPLIEFDKFPIIIGGEHSLTLGAVRGCVDRYADLSVLQIAAGANCRQSCDGNPYSQGCISYQVYKALPHANMIQVGIRSISQSEVQWMETEKPRISIFWARHQDKWNFHDMVNALSDNIYLSIDLCALDPSIMPATANPQPGGMSWYQLMELIKQVCIKKNVVAADVVGLTPLVTQPAPAMLAAKAIYKLIGYRFALDLGVSKKYL